ncbi:MAG TPA: MFS transporter [Kineosporiaceae bacterium]
MSALDTGRVLSRIRPADLRKLRYGQTVSMFGDAVTSVALPTVALLVVQATPFQFGLLSAATFLPYPFIGLPVGAWVDRTRRRKVMVLADATRFLAIASIPAAAFTGGLTFAQLLVIGLVVGVASVFFNAAYQAYLPSIVGKDQITQANAKLSVSENGSQVFGPPLAGVLIGALGAAPALLIDALTFLASIASLTFIRRVEEDPRPALPVDGRSEPLRRSRRRHRRNRVGRSRLGREILEGLQVVLSDRLMLGLTLTAALSNLGRGMCLELFLLFAYKGLYLSPGVAGTVLAVGNIGSLLGSLTCQRFTDTFGLGTSLRVTSLLKGLPWLFAPLTLIGPPLPISIAIIVVSSYFVPISLVTTVSIRQSLVSREIQGRVASTTRTISTTAIPLAAVLGGVLAQAGTATLGARAGLAVVLALGGLIWMSATVLLPRRRLETLKTISDLEQASASTEGTHQDDTRPTEPTGRGRSTRPANSGPAVPPPLPSPYDVPAWITPVTISAVTPPRGRPYQSP